MRSLCGGANDMGRMELDGRGDTTAFSFVTDVRIYLHRWSYGVQGTGTGYGYGIIVPFHLYTPSPLLAGCPVVKLDWSGLDWIV